MLRHLQSEWQWGRTTLKLPKRRWYQWEWQGRVHTVPSMVTEVDVQSSPLQTSNIITINLHSILESFDTSFWFQTHKSKTYSAPMRKYVGSREITDRRHQRQFCHHRNGPWVSPSTAGIFAHTAPSCTALSCRCSCWHQHPQWSPRLSLQLLSYPDSYPSRLYLVSTPPCHSAISRTETAPWLLPRTGTN